VNLLLKVSTTLTRKIEPFKPREDEKLKCTVAGPQFKDNHTHRELSHVYLRGHTTTYLEYLGYEVVRLLTFTDIKDNATAEADKEKVSIKKLTQRNAETFFAEARLLRTKSSIYPNPKPAEVTTDMIF